jgi:excisionase family DNA binding protein
MDERQAKQIDGREGSQARRVCVLMFAWCEGCARQVRVTTTPDAAARAGVSASTIYRWAGAGRIHAVKTVQGRLVCLDSLYPERV